MSWQKRWEEEDTPWDAGASPPELVRLVEQGALPNGRALVPGAGSGYDVITLASPEREVIGLELSPVARARFVALREASGVLAASAQVVVADFFDYSPAASFDLIWDYTFLCALPPEYRPRWARRVDELLAPDGELVTLIFPVVEGGDPSRGPPYIMSPDLVRAVLGEAWEPTTLEPVQKSNPGREGAEWLGRWRKRGS